jgi:cytochrome b561
MVDLSISPTKLRLYSWHKWAGVTIFTLVLVRSAWRLSHAAPAMPDQLPRWQRAAAEASHFLLFVMMILIPLSGWLMSSAKGFQTVYFGILPIPDLLDKNKELGETLALVHKFLTFALIPIVILHAGAALKHHFIDKDDVLKRMLPSWNRRPS